MYSVNLAIDWEQTSTVVISGVVIVLGVLLVLIAIFIGFGKTVSKSEKASKNRHKNINNAHEVAAPAGKIQAPPVPRAVPVSASPASSKGISGEVIAAITAAIAASEGGRQVVIRSIKKKNVGTRNPWAAAAISENTKPF